MYTFLSIKYFVVKFAISGKGSIKILYSLSSNRVKFPAFLTFLDRVYSFVYSARKYFLAYWLRQLTRDTKSDFGCLQTSFTRHKGKLRMAFEVGYRIR